MIRQAGRLLLEALLLLAAARFVATAVEVIAGLDECLDVFGDES